MQLQNHLTECFNDQFIFEKTRNELLAIMLVPQQQQRHLFYHFILEDHDNFTCTYPHCQELCSSQSHLKEHYHNHHQSSLIPVLVPKTNYLLINPKNSLHCQTCNKTFDTLDDFTEDTLSHLQEIHLLHAKFAKKPFHQEALHAI